MPRIKSAKKRVRQIKKRTKQNKVWKEKLKSVKRLLSDLTEKGKSPEEIKKELSFAYKIIDKAAKVRVIHKNKAARLKSRLSKRALMPRSSRK